MSYKKSNLKIWELICTNYPFVHVVTEDDNKTIQGIKETVDLKINLSGVSFDVITWNPSYGFSKELTANSATDVTKYEINSKDSTEDKYRKMFQYIKAYKQDAVFIIQEIDYCYDDADLLVELKELIANISSSINKSQRKLRRLENGSNSQKMIYVLSDKVSIPDKLNKLATVTEYALPGKEDLYEVISIFVKERALNIGEKELLRIAEAGIGLTEFEFSNAVFNSFVINRGQTISLKNIVDLKEQSVKKGGLLEFIKTDINMSDVGGLENLMDWVKKREMAFDEEKRNSRKLKFPKGILMTGIPGCGKSLSAKAIANQLQLPLLKLDTGALMGKYVGETDANTRKAIALAESLAPAVLWVDEIEKALPTGDGAHEVSKRLLSYLLTWLQEKKAEVFVVATANNINSLPPELLRKGRFSEIFFIDLPKEAERRVIFDIHLKKVNAKFDGFDLEKVAKETKGFSGAEIEEVVQEANFQSAYEDAPLALDYVLNEIQRTTPLSVVMGDKLKAIEKWAVENKVRPASREN